ncbi:dTDP-glucose 4,6-dehydratase [Patescibacteria group bacterium]
MKLLVTGGSGFIGSNFILYWMDHHPKDTIVNLDKLTYAGNPENLASIEKMSNYTFIHGDICDKDVVRKSLEGVDIVVHFAAESHVDRSIIMPGAFIRTNIEGTYVLLEASVKANIQRFHHISTDEVFGSLTLDSKEKFDENTLYDPRSPYSASKAASDHLVRSYHHTYNLPITISNCSNNYGPYQFPEKLIPLAITNILENKKVPIYGDGLYIRDWLYVEDHAKAIDLILEKGKIGETYCVGGVVNDLNNLNIIKKISQLMGKDESDIEFVKDRPGHDRKYAIDAKKIINKLGWKPLYDFDTYLDHTIKWYEKNQSWWKKIKSGKYLDYYKNQYGESV